jgi:hypothetical protein
LFGKLSPMRRHRSAPNESSAQFVSSVVSPGRMKMGRLLMM